MTDNVTMDLVHTATIAFNSKPKPHNTYDHSRNIAISRIKTTMRTISRREEFPDIATLFGRFESLYADIPTTKKQALELDPEVIETKVIAICSVREEIKSRCESTSSLDSFYNAHI